MAKQLCTHDSLTFLGILKYLEYPEKLFYCNHCHSAISDFITEQELSDYSTGKLKKLEMIVNTEKS
jgi:hypothetical protein